MDFSALPLPLPLFLLFGVLAIAMYTDIRYRKIRNWLVIAGLVGGLLSHYIDAGSSGLIRSLSGLGVALLLTLPLVMLRVLAAGDSKLLLVVGMAIGWPDFVTVLAIALVSSGILALAGSLLTGRLHLFGANIAAGTGSILNRDWHAVRSIADSTAYRVPFAVPTSIAVGIWLYWFY